MTAVGTAKLRCDALKAELRSMKDWVVEFMDLHCMGIAGAKDRVRRGAVDGFNADVNDWVGHRPNERRVLNQSHPFAPPPTRKGHAAHTPVYKLTGVLISESHPLNLQGRIDVKLV